MSHKLLVRISILMVIVFGATIIAYPLIFSPKASEPAAPVAPANR